MVYIFFYKQIYIIYIIFKKGLIKYLNLLLLNFIFVLSAKIKCIPDRYLDIQLATLILSTGNENGIATDSFNNILNINISPWSTTSKKQSITALRYEYYYKKQ